MTVIDVVPPTLTCPANITQNVPLFGFPTPIALDNYPGATVSCTPASDSAFFAGTTPVTCTATDASGNTATCGFTVTVIDVDDDDDDDGVADGSDTCPGTGDEVVNPAGCSIDQLCPCIGPRGTNQAWKNHGGFVSCVSTTSQGFLAAGLISAAERAHEITDAARSECGRKP